MSSFTYQTRADLRTVDVGDIIEVAKMTIFRPKAYREYKVVRIDRVLEEAHTPRTDGNEAPAGAEGTVSRVYQQTYLRVAGPHPDFKADLVLTGFVDTDSTTYRAIDESQWHVVKYEA